MGLTNCFVLIGKYLMNYIISPIIAGLLVAFIMYRLVNKHNSDKEDKESQQKLELRKKEIKDKLERLLIDYFNEVNSILYKTAGSNIFAVPNGFFTIVSTKFNLIKDIVNSNREFLSLDFIESFSNVINHHEFFVSVAKFSYNQKGELCGADYRLETDKIITLPKEIMELIKIN
jgi:phosphate/sulfate permease